MVAPQVGYSVFTWPKGAVDVVAGQRSWHVKAELTAILPSMSSGAETSADSVDCIVGAGVRAAPWGPAATCWRTRTFGAGGSDFTWQAFGAHL